VVIYYRFFGSNYQSQLNPWRWVRYFLPKVGNKLPLLAA